MTDLTDREWRLLEAMRTQIPLADIALEWGVTRQAVDHIRVDLEEKGLIVRDPQVPAFVRFSTRYPWSTRDLGPEVRYKPALPPAAKLRALYPVDSRRDRSVAPIRLVTWDEVGWSAQGLPTCPPDGQHLDTAVPDRKGVWCVLGDLGSWMFPARLDAKWPESGTVRVFRTNPWPSGGPVVLNVDERQVVTAMIGAAVGVGVVWDLGAVPVWAERSGDDDAH